MESIISKMNFTVIFEPMDGGYTWRAINRDECSVDIEFSDSQFKYVSDNLKEAVKEWKNFAKINGIKKYEMLAWMSKKVQIKIK